MTAALQMAAERAVTLLRQRHLTVSTAESCTGGMLSCALTAVPGASAVLELGIVSYSCRAKREAVGVKEETLCKHGAISRETAGEMAAGVRERAHADFGLSVTGAAGPDPSEGHPVGTVYIGLADCDSVTVRRLSLPDNGRDAIRAAACETILALLIDTLERRSPNG